MNLIRVKQIDNNELNNFIDIPVSEATGTLYSLIQADLDRGYSSPFVSTIISQDIPSGINYQWIDYSFCNFSGAPNLDPTIIYNIGNTGIYLPFVSGAFRSGCYIGYSSTITETGLKLNLQVNDTGYSGGYTFVIQNIYSGNTGASLNFNDLNNYLATGNFNLNDSVRTTGNQEISGNKIFINSGEIILNIFNKILSGDWQTNTTPTQPQHIINKIYLDSGSNGGNLIDSGKHTNLNSYGQLNYNTIPLPDLGRDVDKRIYGLTASTGNKLIYSTINDSTSSYIRNTGCWGYGIDLTPISVWNSQYGSGRGCILISPRHILMADHYPITGGALLRFVDNNNNTVTAGLSGSRRILNTDLRVGVLSGDITGNISYSKVLPSDFTGYFNTSGIPIVFADAEKKLNILESNQVFSSDVNCSQSANIYRSGFFELPIAGDSSSPICAVIGNELVALSTLFTASYGNYISYYYNLVNSGISALGNSNNYSLTPVSKNFYPLDFNSLANKPNPVINNNYFITGDGGFGDITTFLRTTGSQEWRTPSCVLYFSEDQSSRLTKGLIIFDGDDDYPAYLNNELLSLPPNNGSPIPTSAIVWHSSGLFRSPSYGNLLSKESLIINLTSTNLFTLSGTQGSNWKVAQAVNTPFSGRDIVSKEHLDSQITGLSGYLTNNLQGTSKQNYSYYFDYVFTGLSVSECFIQENSIITGIKIGCIETGRGPAHLTSGFSGQLIFSPLTGQFYQRTINNSKIIGGNFGINSGQLFTSYSINYNITGENRLGLDILSGLSGIYGVSISLLGYAN